MLVHFLSENVNFIRQNNNFEIYEVNTELEKVNFDLESKRSEFKIEIKYHNNIVQFIIEKIKI